MGNVLNISYFLVPAIVNTGQDSCNEEFKEIQLFDVNGTFDTEYGVNNIGSPSLLMDCKVKAGTRGEFRVYERSELVDTTGRVLYVVSSLSTGIGFWVEIGKSISMDSTTVPMEGTGGVDLPTVSLYSGLYQAGFYATFQVTEFDASLISVSFQDAPNRYVFGNYSVLHHGHVAERHDLDARSVYVPLHVWFPTLEPAGEVQDVNVWVPVPTWERGSALRWHLYPSVKGVCKVWWMKLLTGIDAYF